MQLHEMTTDQLLTRHSGLRYQLRVIEWQMPDAVGGPWHSGLIAELEEISALIDERVPF